MPKLKQQNKDSQNVSSDENYQEKRSIFQKITPVKIILKDTKITEGDNDIEVNFRQALNRGSATTNDVEEIETNETLKQNNDMVNDNKEEISTIASGTAIPETISTEDYKTTENVTDNFTSTEGSGLYPTAVYDNQTVNTITIANGSPDYFLLPPLLNEDWKNFTLTTNINVVIENNTKPSTIFEVVTKSPSVNKTDGTIKGPYSAALYNNAEIDQLSITTNSYTNESPLPPPQDDRWRSFSSLGEISASNEFRPLAGLYYDGFLHRPPYKYPGFVPYNRYVLY